MENKKFKISLSLNVLNHLGINLYSNTPAVLSEIVANAWDADATQVIIDIDPSAETITVIDDGHGMTVSDLNNKFLCVGFQRRKAGEAITPKYQRSVMGRKGIGKLSLFSIADTIEVHSVKDGEKSGLIMNLHAIQDAIKDADREKNGIYNPEEVDINKIEISTGTKIVIRDLRKKINKTAPYLRTRLARRFAVLGPKYNFNVKLNNQDLTILDRDYFSKLQYIWTIGDKGKEFLDYAKNTEENEHLTGELDMDGKRYEINGWLGTFLKSGDAKDSGNESLNSISILVRGKLAQENILDEFGDAGIYAQYLIGEIHADFLDIDDDQDIATSSRQKLIENDPRYEALRDKIKILIGHIRQKWTDLRNKKGEDVARKNPLIDEWVTRLKGDNKQKAKSLFGKINQMAIDESERERLFTHAVIAFESLRYKEQLSALENVSINNLGALAEIFTNFDDIEASLYHQITRERIEVIQALQNKVEQNALEEVIQKYLFKHLWLLDPMWERATETPVMEQTVSREFGKIDVNLTPEERTGRLDIKYKTTSGSHIIIELKRASIRINTLDLVSQVRKYKTALTKCLKSAQKENEPIEIVCVLGSYPIDWDDSDSKNLLSSINARIVLYTKLIDQSYQTYSQYLDKNKEASSLTTFLEKLTNPD